MKQVTLLTILAVILSVGIVEAQPDTVWTRLYGGPIDDHLWGTIATPDNGAGLLIQQSVTADSAYGAVLRLDASGDSIWSCLLPWSTATNFLFAGHDETLVVARQRYENLAFLLITPEGRISQQIDLETPYAQRWIQLIDLEGREYFLRGETEHPYRPIVMKLNSSADTLWRREFRSDYELVGDEIIALQDGGCALLSHEGLNNQFDIRFIRMDEHGEIVFDQILGGEGSSYPYGIWENIDGTFTILAQWLEQDSLCFLQISEAGELLNISQSINRSRFGAENVSAILLHDGSFLVWSSYIWSWIARVNSNGDQLWWQNGFESIQDVALASDGGLLFATTNSSHYRGRFRNQDFWVMRLEFPPNGIENEIYHPLSNTLLSSYPNPFNSSTVIEYHVDRPGFVTLGVIDGLGRSVGALESRYAVMGSYRAEWNARTLPAGKYNIVLTSPAGNAVRGVTLVK